MALIAHRAARQGATVSLHGCTNQLPCSTIRRRTHTRAFTTSPLHSPASCRKSHRVRASQAAGLTDDRTKQLEQFMNQLKDLKQSEAEQSQIDDVVEKVKELAVQLGVNKVIPEWNDGAFESYAVQGRLSQKLAGGVTLGELTFRQFQPADLKLQFLPGNDNIQQTGPAAFKGSRWGRERVYSVSSKFRLEDDPTVQGVSHAIAEYTQDLENPTRLNVAFSGLRLEPLLSAEGSSLQRWIEKMKPHNPTMDDSGVVEVVLDKMPHGWLDHFVMLPDYQLLLGNMGSVTLFKRAG